MEKRKQINRLANKHNQFNKNYLKLVSSIIIVGVFIFLAFGSGENAKKSEWKKNSKENFCGKEFRNSHTIEAIDMTIKVVTVLNCDGTYTSKEDWGTSKRNEETYNNTVGRSSGNNEDFSGTWEIVDKVSDEDAVKLVNRDESNTQSIAKMDPNATMIRYTSNLGKTRYATVYKYEQQLWLSPIAYEVDCHDKTYEYKDLNMYDGSCYAE
jgi:hypothetical protein